MKKNSRKSILQTRPPPSEEEDEDEVKVQIFKKTRFSSPSPFQTTTTTAEPSPLPPQNQIQKKASGKIDSFHSLGLDNWLCETLDKLAISKPTPVQIACIPEILRCKDILLAASAPTGTGKTAAFALPMLHHFALDPFGVFGLVLTPTRELGQQLNEQFCTLGSKAGLKVELIIGGVNQVNQQLALQKAPHVIVATPGRLASHLLGAKPPNLSRLRFLVLDESDRLLKSGEGFENDLKRLAQHLKLDHLSVLLFSATLSAEDFPRAHELGLSRSHKPDFVFQQQQQQEVERSESQATVHLCPTTLVQTLTLVPFHAKHAYLVLFLKHMLVPELIERSKLKDLVPQSILSTNTPDREDKPTKSLIIFTSSCFQAQFYTELLSFLDLPVVGLHSELKQEVRSANLAKFRSGSKALLVCTDVASRGLDIPTVDVVLNLDVPREAENYVHRVGRCARAARTGRAFTFVCANEIQLVKAIESFIHERLTMHELAGDVASVLRRASVARVKAITKLHRDGFMDRLEVRKERRKKKYEAGEE